MGDSGTDTTVWPKVPRDTEYIIYPCTYGEVALLQKENVALKNRIRELEAKEARRKEKKRRKKQAAKALKAPDGVPWDGWVSDDGCR